MSLISNFGPEQSPIWVVVDEPYSTDAADSILMSGGIGFTFKKLWKLAGLNINDVHIRSIKPCIGASYSDDAVLSKLLATIEVYRPTFIVPLSDLILNYLVPHTTQAKEKNSSMAKWAGSLLQSKYLTYPHYVIGSQPPDWVVKNWDYNEIQAFIDFGHIREEFDYWRQHGQINSLPSRNLCVMPDYSDLMLYLHQCKMESLLSVDIETIRPRKDSTYWRINPGYPYTIAIAKSPKDAISFSFWDYEEDQCIKIWRLLDELFTKIPQIGQNYFLFDSHYLEAMGFNLNSRLPECKDTLIRHHILWPSLRHALHFQTRQYTREPYYKDEGKNFNLKKKKEFMIYNAKDAAVTYEIYEQQEQEFQERKWLQ